MTNRAPTVATSWPSYGAWLVVALTVLLVLTVRFRLREVPLERDEGEYAYAGQLILQGIPPYQYAYNMKLPGTYGAYALIMAVFGQTPAGIHIGLALVNAASVVLIFLIGRRLLDTTTGVVAAVVFALLSMTPLALGLAAHATHFVVLPALGGILLLLKATEGSKPVFAVSTVFVSGLLFGLAFLMKQHGIFFGVFGFLYLVWVVLEPWLVPAKQPARSLQQKLAQADRVEGRAGSYPQPTGVAQASQPPSATELGRTDAGGPPAEGAKEIPLTPTPLPMREGALHPNYITRPLSPEATGAAQASQPAGAAELRRTDSGGRAADSEVGDTAGSEACATQQGISPPRASQSRGSSEERPGETRGAGSDAAVGTPSPPAETRSSDLRAGEVGSPRGQHRRGYHYKLRQGSPSRASDVLPKIRALVRSQRGALLAFAAGLFLPYILTCLVLLLAGVFPQFVFWTVSYASKYAMGLPLNQVPGLFLTTFGMVLGPNVALWLLALAGALLMWWNRRLTVRHRFFLIALLVCSLGSVSIGLYFREHYFILFLPAIGLLSGVAVSRGFRLLRKNQRLELFPAVPVLVLFILGIVADLVGNGAIWFTLPVEQVYLRIYATTVFADAAKAAEYIRTHSTKDARVAVMGSEPEIYFYAHRRSATGYIYTYPLMEGQPYAARMQAEMIDEIERTKPEYVVFVKNRLSWLPHPGFDPGILRWWDRYWATNLDLVTTIDTRQGAELRDEVRGANAPGEAGNSVLLLKRR